MMGSALGPIGSLSASLMAVCPEEERREEKSVYQN